MLRQIREIPPEWWREEVVDAMRKRIAALSLDLGGLHLVTEAATGAYACTAVIAALAGAERVVAVSRDSASHGSAQDAIDATLALARVAGVERRIEVAERLVSSRLEDCDIITNSGRIRPLNASIIERLPAKAVVALMYEAWEFRSSDLDLEACRARGIRVAAVNERHEAVGVFPFLGDLCVKLLNDHGCSPVGARVALICDNPFAPYMLDGLRAAGAVAECFPGLMQLRGDWEIIVVALNPSWSPPMRGADLRALACAASGALVAQIWGDIDRRAAAAAGFVVIPRTAPKRGHMAVLLSDLGYEPIVRLQAGGLRAAELVRRSQGTTTDPLVEFV
jgi:hypothetical protein